VIQLGHYDLTVNYVLGDGWHTTIYDYGTGDHLSPTSSIYRIGEEALTSVPDNADYQLLGNPGERIWIMPETYNPEVVYLGIGAPLLGRNIFTGGLSNRGQVTLRLIDLSGSGPASGGALTLWQSGFPPRFHFSSADGIGPEDTLNAITANFHAHYNWAFSKPGLYRVTFEYSGTLLAENGGGDTSVQVTYSFEVGDGAGTSALRYAWPLGDGWQWSSWMGTVYTANDPWIWDYRLGWMYVPPSSPDTLWMWTVRHGWTWTSQYFYPWLWRPSDDQWILSGSDRPEASEAFWSRSYGHSAS
jgi:surface-anchored protein